MTIAGGFLIPPPWWRRTTPSREGSILMGLKRAIILIARTSALLSWLRTGFGRRGVMRGYLGRWPRW